MSAVFIRTCRLGTVCTSIRSNPFPIHALFCSALGVSTLSYAWWMFTNKDLQHSNIFDFFFDSMIKRRYEKGGLDEARLEMAQVRSGPSANPDPIHNDTTRSINTKNRSMCLNM